MMIKLDFISVLRYTALPSRSRYNRIASYYITELVVCNHTTTNWEVLSEFGNPAIIVIGTKLLEFSYGLLLLVYMLRYGRPKVEAWV